MKKFLFSSLLFFSAAACTPQQNTAVQTATDNALKSTPGQLFCAIQTTGGGTIVAGIVNASVTAAAPTAAPAAVIATGATKAFIDATCAQAAANAGGIAGIPVSPPSSPTSSPPTVAVK